MSTYHLFERLGVELEYMIVESATLDVLPISDVVLVDDTGQIQSEVEHDDVAWSNELVAHVVELKTAEPATTLAGLAPRFQQNVRDVNKRLATRGARLLPTGMHPWMDPARDARLWAHEYNEVYEAFNRIFNCQGHGWCNLQSMHLNLPFAGDEEFARLHAAIRLLLPILPALAASSPVFDGRLSGLLDTRLDVYRHNAARVPIVSGRVVPEPVFSQTEYDRDVFQPMYAAIAPHDPEGVLQHEWLNARGAIARFDRGTIEIRVLDVQECPRADMALAAAIVGVLRLLVAEHWTPLAAQQSWTVESLEPILHATIREADAAAIDNADYLRAFGYTGPAPSSAHHLWSHLIEKVGQVDPSAATEHQEAWQAFLGHGPLARRIVTALDGRIDRDRLFTVYERLADCLQQGELLR